MVKYFCDVRGCNYTSANKSDLIRVKIAKSNVITGPLPINEFDMCPECSKRFNTMLKYFCSLKTENPLTYVPVPEEDKYTPDMHNEMFSKIFYNFIDKRTDACDSELVQYYNVEYRSMNFLLVELVRLYFNGDDYEDIAKAYGLNEDFVKNFYINLRRVALTIDISSDDDVDISALVDKYWRDNEEEKQESEDMYRNFNWYIFYIMSAIVSYMHGINYNEPIVLCRNDKRTAQIMYVALDNLIFDLNYKFDDMLNNMKEPLIMKDVIAAFAETSQPGDDFMSADTIAHILGLNVSTMLGVFRVYGVLFDNILAFYKNMYEQGIRCEDVPNKYYLYKQTIKHCWETANGLNL